METSVVRRPYPNPIGKNTLQNFLSNMCIEADIQEKTKYNLCATGATAMFAAQVSEKRIEDNNNNNNCDLLRKRDHSA